MRLSTQLSYQGGFEEAARLVAELERVGLDVVWAAEAYGFDAVSFMGYLAAVTERVEIGSAILPIYTRTPSLLAMTAAGVDSLSEGRCILGLGASGPQVIEGFHGVPYVKPLARTREIIDVCRMAWKRERLAYQGSTVQLPLPPGQGTGLGKPLKMISHPVRDRIPVYVAALGPKNVEMTAEVADGWLPILFHPERPACATSPARWSPSTWAAWAPGAATSTTTWPGGTATSPRPSSSRTSTSTARRTRPPPRCPSRSSRPPTCAAPRAT